jgi:predicted ester cyclase
MRLAAAMLSRSSLVQVLGRAGRADKNRPRGGRLVAATIHRSPLGDAVTQDLNTLAQDYVRLWDVSAPAGIADRLYTPDVVDHNPLPGQGPGLDGIKQLVTVYHSVFPDLSVSTDDVVSSGDRVVVRWTGTGTHQGDQLGVPATGKQVRLTGIDILRVEDGRIVERWGETNGLEMMQQITSA